MLYHIIRRYCSHLNSSLFLIGQPLLLNLIGVPAAMYIIRGLGPHDYGAWCTALALVATVSVLGNLGLRTLFVRGMSQDPDGVADALADQLVLRTALSAIGAGLAVGACWCLQYPSVVIQCTAITALGFLVSSANVVLSDVVQAQQRFRAFALVNFITGILLTAASVVAVWLHTGPLGVAISYLTAPILGVPLWYGLVAQSRLRIYVRWRPREISRLLHQTRELAGQILLGTIQDRMDQILVPKMVGLSQFGYFSAGSLPANRLGAVPDGLMTAAYPALSKTATEDREALKRGSEALTAQALAFCLPLVVAVSFLATEIAEVLFPRHAAPCALVLRLTIWSVALLAVLQPMICSLQASGHHAEAARAGTWAVFLGAPASAALIWRYGLPGAGCAVILRPLLGAVILAPTYLRVYPAIVRIRRLIAVVASVAPMAAALWLLHGYSSGPALLLMAGKGTLACLVYGVTFLAVRHLIFPGNMPAGRQGETGEYPPAPAAESVGQPAARPAKDDKSAIPDEDILAAEAISLALPRILTTAAHEDSAI